MLPVMSLCRYIRGLHFWNSSNLIPDLPNESVQIDKPLNVQDTPCHDRCSVPESEECFYCFRLLINQKNRAMKRGLHDSHLLEHWVLPVARLSMEDFLNSQRYGWELSL